MASTSRSRSRGSEPDALSVIERAYALEIPPAQWLRELAECVYGQLGQGLGLMAYFYRVDDDARISVGESVALELDHVPQFPIGEMMSMLPPEFVRKSFIRCECTTQSEAMDDAMREQLGPILEANASMFGWYDALMLGGMDASGDGVYLGAWLPKVTRMSPAARALWSRVAIHIATANRLRARLHSAAGAHGTNGAGRESADAVLRPDGRVEHAQNDAADGAAREALRNAVRMMETARGRLRRDEPREAVDAWRALVAGRWSLVDQVESDGRRYIVARRNEARVGQVEALSERERQAVAHAALQHSNKLIAYEIGVSASTVGVLLHRAARKLGVRSRDELVAAYRAWQAARAGSASAAEG